MYGWNSWLKHGFGMFAVAELLMATAYLVYVSCVAEIVSGFPFSGGGYGLARVAQGYYIGFLVGCCEVLEYIAYSALSFLYASELLCLILDIDSQYSILFCFFCYVIAAFITIHKSRILVYTNYAIAAVSLAIVLVFCFGTMRWANFDKASLQLTSNKRDIENWFGGGMPQFLGTLPETTVFYGGIEALSLLPSLANEPRTSIPRGLLLGMAVLFATNMLMLFVIASMPDGIEATSFMPFPMEVGFELIFKFSRYGTLILMLPAQFGQGFGFVLPFAKLLQSLGTTNLLPSFLRLNNCENHHSGVIVGSVCGFMLCCLCEYHEGENLAHICILAGFLTYLSQLHGYYVLKTKYTTAVREFTSSFGLAGAFYAALIFLLGLIGIIGFSNNHTSIGFILVYLFILSVYYHWFAAKTQTIAKEEQAVLFQLHVAKQNRRRKKRAGLPATNSKGPTKNKLKAAVVAACEDSEKRQKYNVVGNSATGTTFTGGTGETEAVFPSGEALLVGSYMEVMYSSSALDSESQVPYYGAHHGHENTADYDCGDDVIEMEHYLPLQEIAKELPENAV